uniref:Uncharacterized protein n=1 Tax=Zea mays TaxID=4577 RepID=C0PLL4_MAIZE|nr:unknown [Zea mays]
MNNSPFSRIIPFGRSNDFVLLFLLAFSPFLKLARRRTLARCRSPRHGTWGRQPRRRRQRGRRARTRRRRRGGGTGAARRRPNAARTSGTAWPAGAAGRPPRPCPGRRSRTRRRPPRRPRCPPPRPCPSPAPPPPSAAARGAPRLWTDPLRPWPATPPPPPSAAPPGPPGPRGAARPPTPPPPSPLPVEQPPPPPRRPANGSAAAECRPARAGACPPARHKEHISDIGRSLVDTDGDKRRTVLTCSWISRSISFLC